MDIYPPVNYGPAAVYMGAVGRGGIFDVPIPTLDSHFFFAVVHCSNACVSKLRWHAF